MQENNVQEFSDTRRTFNFECLEHQPSCSLVQIAGELSSEIRMSMQANEKRVGITKSCILVNQGELLKVQEGSKEGRSLAVSTWSSKSKAANTVGEQQKDIGAFRALDLLNTKIHLPKGMDREESEAGKGLQPGLEPMATSYPTLQVVGQS